MIQRNLVGKRSLFAFIFLCFTINFASADISLPKIIGDNMVLQRDMKVPLWGNADPGEKVTATLGGHYAETFANPDGRWKLYIGPLDAGGPFELQLSGKNKILIKNVLVGEVWVCSGQSNMALEVRSCMNAIQEIQSANYPQIRLFQVKHAKASSPLDDVSPVEDSKMSGLNTWLICAPSTVAHFSGAGYFFGRCLFKELDLPIGLIDASWGGTTAEAWTPRDTLANDPELKRILQDWPDYNNDEEWLKEEYAKFVEDVKKAKQQRTEAPLYFNQPSVLYNGILAPVIPFGIRGVTWYQGESNAYRAYQYQKLFPALIQQWRKKWEQGDFPFLFVQLANYHFEPQVFPELREAQSMALSVPRTAMAVTIDIGDSADIHPKNKQEVGRRLSLAARKLAYGETLIFSGPTYRSMTVAKGACRLNFDHVGDGLTIKSGDSLSGFEIAGKDRSFMKAQAIIDGDQVVVWSDSVPNPVAVRYAWANNPEACNLYNKSGEQINLPASPFRTDDWPGITFGRE